MTISVRILAPDLVEITVRPSWLARLFGARAHSALAERIEHLWRWEQRVWWLYPVVDCHIADAISRSFAEADAQRRAETARNYQAAAQRGEYPIR